MRWLVLNLSAPLAAFGGKAVDGYGPTEDFPALSALTGLLGNALGYERRNPAPLDNLQKRLVFGARHDTEDLPERLIDFQTAQLGLKDTAWTFFGIEGRKGSAATYDSPAIRNRHFVTDISMTVVVRLRDAAKPDLDDLARALTHPARPLFIGRKSCLPDAPVFGGFIEAGDLLGALRSAPAGKLAPSDPGAIVLAQWPAEEASSNDGTRQRASDIRSFAGDVHKGARKVMTGTITMAGV